jgi:hypothetical protein
MSILRPGSEIDHDLKAIGERFRQTIGDLTFDRFVVDVVTKNGTKASGDPS